MFPRVCKHKRISWTKFYIIVAIQETITIIFILNEFLDLWNCTSIRVILSPLSNLCNNFKNLRRERETDIRLFVFQLKILKLKNKKKIMITSCCEEDNGVCDSAKGDLIQTVLPWQAHIKFQSRKSEVARMKKKLASKKITLHAKKKISNFKKENLLPVVSKLHGVKQSFKIFGTWWKLSDNSVILQ